MRRELEAAQRALAERSRFLATASHDLRQPIHAIGLFAAALRAELPGGRPRELLDRLERAMRGLDDLFNRLLDISRIDGGQVACEPRMFALAPLLQTLEGRYLELARARGLDLRLHESRVAFGVRSDPTLLAELLMNLISNAVRHTARGGVLVGARRRGDRVSIEIWDTGPGIEAPDRARVFDEFVQLRNPGRDARHGSGLGLAIVRRLAAILDLPVTLESRPGRGSVFKVSVPLVRDQPPGDEAAATVAPHPALTGALVMVVDDQIDVLIGMQAILSAWGCFVLIARGRSELRAQLEATERFPDVLVAAERLQDGTRLETLLPIVRELVPVVIPVIAMGSGTEAGAAGESQPGSVAPTVRRSRDTAEVEQSEIVARLDKPANPVLLQRLLVEQLGAQ